MATKLGNTIAQVQKQEQRQMASRQQMLAAQLTELSVEELIDHIQTVCDDNPWLEASLSTGNGSEDDYDYTSGYDGNTSDTELGKADSNYEEENGTTEGDGFANNSNYDDDDDIFAPPQTGQDDASGTGKESGEALTFHEILMQQIPEYDLTEHQQAIIEYLIGSLDQDGLLRVDLQRVADELDVNHGIITDEKEVAEVLGVLQQFDPRGVGARNLNECLLIQVERDTSLPMREQLKRMLTEYGEEMKMCHWDTIQREMKITSSELQSMRRSLLRLNPRPGGSVGATPVDSNHSIVPDFIVTLDQEGKASFHLNERNMPHVTLADDFDADSALSLADSADERMQKEILEAMKFQQKRIDEGRMFILALATRRHSLIVTMGAIMRLQKEFFQEGEEHFLRPMKLKDVADLAKLDISTVSRVTRSKTVETPFGVFALSRLFTSGVQQGDEEKSVKQMMQSLQEIVAHEDKRKPFSDAALTKILQEKGYDVARRTVAKYREQLGIPDSRMRR